MNESMRILHVEDDPAFRDLFAEMLSRRDGRFDIVSVADATAGRERVESERVDCVVSDYEMPDEDGIEFLEDVRDANPDLPFVLFTGRGSESVASDAISAGVTDYVQKSGKTDQFDLLTNRLVNAIESYTAQQEVDWQRTILQNVGEGAYVFDADGVMRYASFRLPDLDGISADDWVGREISYLVEAGVLAEIELARIERRAERLRTGEADEARVEIEPGLPDRRVVVELRLTPVHSGPETDLVLATTRDITDRKSRGRKRDEIIDRVTDAIVEVDADWRFTLVNDQAEALYGMDESSLLGQDFWTVFDDALGTRFERRYREVMASREPTSFVERYDGLDGWFDVQVYPNADGGLAFYFRDVSERRERSKQLEVAEARYRALAEHFPNGGVFYFDRDRRYRIVSGSGFDPIETDPADLRGNRPEDVDPFSPAVSDAMRAAMDSTLDGNEETFDVEFEGCVYELRSAPIRDEDGDIAAGLFMTQDVTERRERKQALTEKNERLEAFSKIVSHDLKNPLAVALANLDLVRRDCDSEYLDAVEDGLKRSNDLVDDLLALAQEGEDIGDTEPIDLETVARDCWEGIKTAEAELNITADRTVRADRSRLRQLLSNLMRNAVVHGGPEVTVGVGDRKHGFYVEDDGAGITPEEADKVFDSGYSTADSGTGFGLPIAKRVTEAHGWDIDVAAGSTEGARFEITTRTE